MTRRQHKRVFWSLAGILMVLHVDVFNHGRIDPLIFGWLPRDLAYHMLWVVIAAALVIYFTYTVWREPK